uniref:Peptidase S1 domain-containing protein n=1 Tax=Xenopus tropicalis TaxID=8364 RepID=A0A1B8XSW8_XENTR
MFFFPLVANLPDPRTLQEVTLPLIAANKCNKSYHTYAGGAAQAEIRNDMICTGIPQGGMGACQGDSGGPVSCLKDGLWYLVGVVSFAAGCGLPNRPGVNTLVPSFSDWIVQNDPRASENLRPAAAAPASEASTKHISSLLIPLSLILLVTY